MTSWGFSMHLEDDVRVAVVVAEAVNDSVEVAIPVEFGTGRRDRAVQLWQVIYHISSRPIGVNANLEWSAAISENPEHELVPPNLEAMIRSKAVYGFHRNFFRTSQFTGVGAVELILKDEVVDLKGMLRPFRQLVVFANEMDATLDFRAEIYYSPAKLTRNDLDSINRQKGAYRRT